MSEICPHCNGFGRLRSNRKCFLCDGKGYINSQETDKTEIMSNPDTTVYYKTVPVSEPPTEDKNYICVYQQGVGTFTYSKKEGWNEGIWTITHWLKPCSLSEIIQENNPTSAKNAQVQPIQQGNVEVLVNALKYVINCGDSCEKCIKVCQEAIDQCSPSKGEEKDKEIKFFAPRQPD